MCWVPVVYRELFKAWTYVDNKGDSESVPGGHNSLMQGLANYNPMGQVHFQMFLYQSQDKI